MKVKRVLTIAAHPDDELIGVGGTIRKLVDSGSEAQAIIACLVNYYMKSKKLLRMSKMKQRRLLVLLDITRFIFLIIQTRNSILIQF